MSLPQVVNRACLTAEDYLRQRTPACLPERPAVQGIAELSEGVWAVELEGGWRVVAKHQFHGCLTHGRADDLLAVERKVLGVLATAGCPVPRVLAVDPAAQFIFFEHRGDQTLDHVCQQADELRRRRLGQQAIDRFCQIERTLAERREDLLPCVSPAATLPRLRSAAARSAARAQEGLAQMLRLFGMRPAPDEVLSSHLAEISGWLNARDPSLGSTDYNARNIVVDRDTGKLTFIEFAKIGWDWPERRLVQYTTSLGAGNPDGGFAGLLDPHTVRSYAACGAGRVEDRALALDGHHLLFHLNAAAMLCEALEEPELPRHRALLYAWRRPRHRLRQLVRSVGIPLTDGTPCCEFRALFAGSVDTSIRGEHT